MFSALKQGSQIYVLDKKNSPKLHIGEVQSAVSSNPNYNAFIPNNYIDNKVDITVKIDDSTLELKQINGNLGSATDPVSGIVIAENKDLMSLEVENMLQNSRKLLDSVPYHEKVIQSGEEILKKLNPRYAKEQERDEEMLNLKAKVGGMESKLDKIFDLLTTKTETLKN